MASVFCIQLIGASLSNLFDRKLPRMLLQPACNWALFESGCGLLADDWKWQGTVASYNVTTRELVLNNVARVTGPALTLTAGFFALGYLSTGTGNSAQFRMISDSTAAAGNSIALFVSSPFTNPPAVGALVSFHPGCDGRYKETCLAKFNNGARFGGFPWMPVGNPSMLKISKNFTAGGKK